MLSIIIYNLNHRRGMNRKNQNQNSSDRFLKSKYIQKEKPKLIPGGSSHTKKIMLTDLCPQEKLKIGELIKVNESRRQQIIELTQEMNEIREKFTSCHSKLIQFEQQFEAKQQECAQLMLKLEKLEEKSVEMDINNKKLVIQNHELNQKLDRLQKINKENHACQTQFVPKTESGMQTKKGKTKNRSIQVESEQFLGKSKSNSKLNTKSYERIINDKDRSLKNSYERSHNEIMYSQNSSHRNDEEEDNVQIDQNKEQLVEERLNDLAKQWLDLKEKKVSHLKAQYEHSKAHFFKEEPKEFTCEDLAQEDTHQNTEEPEEIDENQLNNLLKSKNFSASRLLTSKGMMNESQNSRKGSLNQKTEKPKETKMAPIQFTVKQPKLKLGNPSKAIEKTPAYQKYNPSQTNFYESDFMELVDSLNV